MLYKCDRCGYETKQKTNMKYHLNRKKKCVGTIPIHKVQKKYGFKVDKKYKCRYCSKEYKQYQSRWRHEKTHNSMELKLLDKTGTTIIETQQIIKNQNIKTQQNVQNQQNIENVNIIVNNYGKENVEALSAEYIKKILYFYKNTAIPKIVSKKHFNKEYPENHNIAITNINNKYGYMKKSGKWEVINKDKLLEILLNDNFDVISDCFEDMPHGIERRKYFFDRLSKELETKRSRKGIKKIIAENIINGTKTIGITPKDKESDIL